MKMKGGNDMKRILVILILISTVFCFCRCAGEQPTEETTLPATADATSSGAETAEKSETPQTSEEPAASTETPQTSEEPAAPTEWPIPTDADPQDLYALDPEKSPLPSSDIFLDFQVGTPLTEVYRRVGLPQRTSNTKGLLEGRSMALPVTLFEYDTIDGKTFYIFYSRTEKDVGKLDGYKVSFISDEKPLGILL